MPSNANLRQWLRTQDSVVSLQDTRDFLRSQEHKTAVDCSIVLEDAEQYEADPAKVEARIRECISHLLEFPKRSVDMSISGTKMIVVFRKPDDPSCFEAMLCDVRKKGTVRL